MTPLTGLKTTPENATLGMPRRSVHLPRIRNDYRSPSPEPQHSARSSVVNASLVIVGGLLGYRNGAVIPDELVLLSKMGVLVRVHYVTKS